MTFSTLIDMRATGNPDSAAVSDSAMSLTHAKLLARFQSVAAQLAGLGITAVMSSRHA